MRMFLMIIKSAFLFFILLFLSGCGSEEIASESGCVLNEVGLKNEEVLHFEDLNGRFLNAGEGRIKYTLTSDSSLYYYNLGWHQIMDEGRYGQAEVSYRKSLEFDPEFLIGQAVLGRLTLDDEERARIYENVAQKRGSLPIDEEELLGVYHDFVHYTNRREAGDTTARAFIKEALLKAEGVFRKIIHKYPGEAWMKSEYVEFINSVHGPEVALDSLAVLVRELHSDNPFLMGFEASLEAEVGNFEKALNISRKLEEKTIDKTEPKPWAVFADVYFKMDSLTIAKNYADRAVELDFRNLDASRLQTKINQRLALN